MVFGGLGSIVKGVRGLLKIGAPAREVAFVPVEAFLYETLPEGRVRCGTCWHRCELGPGQEGFCRTRRNEAGRLYTLVWGKVAGLSANPIEKKPFYHFYPGTKALTMGTWSCNLTCPWCQNCEISKVPPPPGNEILEPAEFIRLALEKECAGTSFSFNEPTLLLEYACVVFPLAREKGLYNTYVTNGYMTPEALELLCRAGLDAMNVDIKGDTDAVRRRCGAEVARVWENASKAKREGVHVELTTLVIPGVNDREEVWREIAGRIVAELGPETPWHVTRYHPAYKFYHPRYVPPTPPAVLEQAREAGLAEGLKFVYLGNLPGHPAQNTYCPGCAAVLIERDLFTVTANYLVAGNRCPGCGREIPLRSGS